MFIKRTCCKTCGSLMMRLLDIEAVKYILKQL